MAHRQLPDNPIDPADASERQRGSPDSPFWNHFNFPPDPNVSELPNTGFPPFSPGFPPFPGVQTVTPPPGQPTSNTETLTFGNPANTPPVIAPATPSRPSSVPAPSSTVTTPRPASTFDPNDSDVYLCGSIPFVPSQYTCYANHVLCPVLNGKRLVPCGESCYDPKIYGCGDGGLEQIHSGRLPNGSPATNTVPLGVTAWPSGVPIPTPERSFRSSSFSSTLSSSTTNSSTTSSPTSSTLPTSSQAAPTNGTASSAPSDSSLSGNQIAAIAASTSSAVLICAVVVLLLFRRHASKRKLLAQKQVYPEVAFLYDPPVPPPIGTEGLGSSGENSSTSRRSYMVSQGQLPRSEPPSSDSSLRGVGIAEAGASVSAAQAVERLRNERRALRQKKPKLRPEQPLKLAKGLAASGFGLVPSNGRGSVSAPNLESMERSGGAPARVPQSSTSLWDEIDIAAGEANSMPSPAMPQHTETQKSTSPLLPPPDLSTPPQALHSPPEISGTSPMALDQQSQNEDDEPFYRRLQQRLSPTRNPISFSQPRPFPYSHAQRGSGSSPMGSPHSSMSISPSTRSPLSYTDPTPISVPRSTATPFSALTSVSPFTQQGGTATGTGSSTSPWPPGTGGPSAPARTLPSPTAPFGLTTAGPGSNPTAARGGAGASSPYPNPYPTYPYSRTGNYTFLQPELYHPPSPKPTPHTSESMSGISALDTRLESGDTWAGEVLGAMGSSGIFGAHGSDANISSTSRVGGWPSSDGTSAGSPSTGFGASRTALQQQQHGSASLPRYGSRLQVPSAGVEPDDSGSPQSVQYVPHVHDPDSGDDDMDVGMGMMMSGGATGLGNIAEESGSGSMGSEGLLGGAAGGQGGLGMGPGPTTTAGAGGNGGNGKRRLTVRNEF
ncbi:hypothetical protein IWZ01DRAFT_484703 [Phyllosticta capitalensis]